MNSLIQQTPKTVVMKDEATGQFVEIPYDQAPVHKPLEIPKPTVPMTSVQTPTPREKLAFNVLGEEVDMERAYYRGQHGLNTYSSTVKLGKDIFFIEELSGEDFQIFKTQAKDLQLATQAIQLSGDEDIIPEAQEEKLLDLVRQKYSMHRSVVEKCVRGCTNAALATREGRDALYHGAVEELCTSIVSASLLGRGDSDFLT